MRSDVFWGQLRQEKMSHFWSVFAETDAKRLNPTFNMAAVFTG